MSFGENERDKVSLPTHRLCSHYNSYAALETMQGSVTSLTLTALLCLGPCWGHWNQVQTGTLPKPSIWADPGPIIAMGSPVTIWCLGPLDADGYYSLYKERISQPWGMKASLDSKYKASFLINKSMDIHQSGWFQCAYHSSSGWSEWSDPLLLVTEAADTTSPSKHKPDFKSGVLPYFLSLSVHLGPTVASGENVTLRCHSWHPMETFLLSKKMAADPSKLKSKHQVGDKEASFTMNPVMSARGGAYRCMIHPVSTPSCCLTQ
ncbi:leukocyte immunoglobulin-like receptor subfamily B member 4 isoform X2 [Loxodonta africana]|uniref:leukocyte immunoglobulin-like receptor subfamily B member 4 isoform X2 n=1 Tax=Loxodonta africana TaxID=9785 RepID=UPI0030CFFDB9